MAANPRVLQEDDGRRTTFIKGRFRSELRWRPRVRIFYRCDHIEFQGNPGKKGMQEVIYPKQRMHYYLTH